MSDPDSLAPDPAAPNPAAPNPAATNPDPADLVAAGATLPDPAAPPARSPLSGDRFRARFARLKPLILDEWPDLAGDALEAAAGDFDRAVRYIAERTDRTRTLIRRQLAELDAVARQDERRVAPPPDSPASVQTETQRDRALPGRLPEALPEVDRLVAVLERRTEEIAAQVKQEVLPEVRDKARENLGSTLLAALGVGFVLGLLVGGSPRGR